MSFIAKRFERACVWLADCGLAVGFGLPYAFYCRRKQGNSFARFAWQAAAAAAFFAFVFLTQSGVASAGSQNALFFFLTLATGLFGFSFYFLVEHAFRVLTVAQTPPGVMPVVPGVTLPIEAVVAIAIIAVVHELAHGVLCKIVGLRLKSSGALLLGWLPIGAFVEPDEEKFKRLRLRDKRRILIAGSTSNTLFFIVFLGLAFAGYFALQSLVAGVSVESTNYASLIPKGAMVLAVDGAAIRTSGDVNSALATASASDSGGNGGVAVRFAESGSERSVLVPANALVVRETKAGGAAEGVLAAGETIYAIGGVRVSTIDELKAALAGRKQGDAITLETSVGANEIVLGAGGVVGAVFSQEQAFAAVDTPLAGAELAYSLLALLVVILYYTFLLNFVFASVNLLPIFITDGQRVFFEELSAAFGKKKGAAISIALGLLTVALIVINALPWKAALGY